MQVDYPSIDPNEDLTQILPIQQKRTIAFVNHFLMKTVSHLNHFAQTCESRFMEFENKIQKIEASLSILESQLVFGYMAPLVEKLLSGLSIGEGPHWDVQKECLYFVDVSKGTINKYVPSTKTHTYARIGDHLTVVIPVKEKKDTFVVTFKKTLALVEWDGESTEATSIKKIHEFDEGTENIFNDGKCDKTGRFWTGTLAFLPRDIEDLLNMADKEGRLYSVFKNNVKCREYEIGIPNGIAFDHKLGKMYVVDSLRNRIDQYDIDVDEGSLSNVTTIFTLENLLQGNKVICDGMTIDTDGNLWVALLGAGKICKIDPRTPNNVLETIDLPTMQTTSVAFGGKDLDELYVTSANLPDLAKGENPGSIFRITGLSAKGFPAVEAVI